MVTQHIERLALGFVLLLFTGCAANQAPVSPPVFIAPTPPPAAAPPPPPPPPPTTLPPDAVPVTFSSALYYPDTAVGTSYSLDQNIYNTNSFTVSVTALSVTGPYASDYVIGPAGDVKTCIGLLASKSDCYFTISFIPTGGGPRPATLQLLTSASTDYQTLTVDGKGTLGVTSTPTFTPAPGTYNTPQLVTITSEPGATITYSDGTGANTGTDRKTYSGPILVGINEVLTATAVTPTKATSAAVKASYVINLAASTPQLPPNLGPPIYESGFTGGWTFNVDTYLGSYKGQFMTGALRSDGTAITGTFYNYVSRLGFVTPTSYTGSIDAAGNALLSSAPLQMACDGPLEGMITNFRITPVTPPTTYTVESLGPGSCTIPQESISVNRVPSVSGSYVGKQGIPLTVTLLQDSDPLPDGTFPVSGRMTYTTGSCSVDIVLKGAIFGTALSIGDGNLPQSSDAYLRAEYNFAPGSSQGLLLNFIPFTDYFDFAQGIYPFQGDGITLDDTAHCGAAEIKAAYGSGTNGNATAPPVTLIRQ